jgi:hypothetical protein
VEAGSCRTAAYRDLYDVMGVSWGQLGSLNAAQAARLDLLPDASVRSVSLDGGSATVTLSPLAGRSGTRALRLTDADAVDYWLEYRTPAARDAWLAGGNSYRLDSGVLLRRAGTALPDTSLLLDGTPSAAAGWDADLQSALPVGAEIPVSGGDFTVVVRSVSAAGAVVDVVPSPAPTAGTPAPEASAEVPDGVVMSGVEADPAEPVPPADAAPAAEAVPRLHTATPALQSLSETSRPGWAAPVAAGVLAGGLLAAATVVPRVRAARR